MAKAMPPVTPNDLRGAVPLGAPGAPTPPKLDPIPQDLILRVKIEGGLDLYVDQGMVGVDPANPFMVSVIEGWVYLVGEKQSIRYVGVTTFFTSVRVYAVTKPEWWNDRKKDCAYPS